MNNYFASVEMLTHPEARRVPMAVCGDPALRHGIVLAKNEPAKKFGIQTGESTYSAKSKCPWLTILPPHYQEYLRYAKISRGIYSEYTDGVYPFGMDEAWLDLTGKVGTFDECVKTGNEIRERIKRQLGLTISVGVSFNYVFAKLASDMKKPDATTVIPKDSFRDIVWRLPAKDLLFVGDATYKKLSRLSLLSLGDVATQSPQFLKAILGKKGLTLWQFANGDDSSFDPGAGKDDVKSIGNSMTPPRDIRNENEAAEILRILARSVSKRLAAQDLKCSCVSIYVRRDDFSSFTRQHTFRRPTDRADVLCEEALLLLRANHSFEYRPLRSLGITADKLSSRMYEQIDLFDELSS